MPPLYVLYKVKEDGRIVKYASSIKNECSMSVLNREGIIDKGKRLFAAIFMGKVR